MRRAHLVLFVACALAALALAGCVPDYPVGLTCFAADECPPGQVCAGGRCHREDDCALPPPCDPADDRCDPDQVPACCLGSLRSCSGGLGLRACTSRGEWGPCISVSDAAPDTTPVPDARAIDAPSTRDTSPE